MTVSRNFSLEILFRCSQKEVSSFSREEKVNGFISKFFKGVISKISIFLSHEKKKETEMSFHKNSSSLSYF